MIGLKMPKESAAKVPAEKVARVKPEKPVKFKAVKEHPVAVHAEKMHFKVPKGKLEGFKSPGMMKPPKATAY